MPRSHEVTHAYKERPFIGQIGTGRALFVVVVCWTMTCLAGCSGVKAYPNQLEKNLHVQTGVASGSLFSAVRAAVDIHRLGPDCSTDCEGTVQLNSPTIDFGIPSNRWSRLVFVFASYSFWGNRSGTISYETLLKPHVGYHYPIKVTYRDDQYNVVIQETRPGSPVSREIEHKDLQTCPLT
ncbi:MAG: hypothetical protein ACT4O4_05275 [Nitrospiraceae bacterium]